MARILVTGGAGYIGSHTARELTHAGHEIVVYDDLSNGHREAVDPGTPLVVGALHDEAKLNQVFTDWDPEAVVHFAGAIEPGLSAAEPARFYQSNVVGTLALANALVARGIPVVFSSSCAVYGTPPTLPVTEDGVRVPESLYGETKVIGEDIFRSYDTAFGLRNVTLRYFNAAGADLSGTHGPDHRHRVHLVTIACLAALGVVPVVEIFGDDYPTPDGTCQRDYVHVVDLATAHLLAVEALLDGCSSRTFNVGTGVPHSVREVLAAVEEAAGRTIPTRVSRRRSGDPAAVWANGERIRSDLNWHPKLSSLDEIACTAWRWHRNFPDGYASRSWPLVP